MSRLHRWGQLESDGRCRRRAHGSRGTYVSRAGHVDAIARASHTAMTRRIHPCLQRPRPRSDRSQSHVLHPSSFSLYLSAPVTPAASSLSCCRVVPGRPFCTIPCHTLCYVRHRSPRVARLVYVQSTVDCNARLIALVPRPWLCPSDDHPRLSEWLLGLAPLHVTRGGRTLHRCAALHRR